MLGQQSYVVAAFGERGNANGEDRQPVIKILAKRLRLGGSFQIAIGGGDDADIYNGFRI